MIESHALASHPPQTPQGTLQSQYPRAAQQLATPARSALLDQQQLLKLVSQLILHCTLHCSLPCTCTALLDIAALTNLRFQKSTATARTAFLPHAVHAQSAYVSPRRTFSLAAIRAGSDDAAANARLLLNRLSTLSLHILHPFTQPAACSCSHCSHCTALCSAHPRHCSTLRR